MREYLNNYLKETEKLLAKKTILKEDIEQLKTKISFFQHERLIHLIVTLFFSLFALIFMILGVVSYYFLIIFAILIIFVICYIYHYYFLEKKVQYLYKVYDKLKEREWVYDIMGRFRISWFNKRCN